ncbi:MAG: ATP-binding protein [Fimbriimonadales bacterium]|nr:ATP-binding protein [Fimbriimonadales bacterium]
MEGQLRSVIQEKVVEGTTRAVPPFTPRDARVPQVPNKAFAVIGMRRVGKTTFLWQVLRQRMERGMPREHALYFNFEDERLLDLRAQDLQLIVETYYQLYPQTREQAQTLFLLDEIQRVADWETFARRLLDSENVALFVSGSSARMLAYELGTSMRGRALPIVIYPFSFREYLRHLGEEPDRSYVRLRKAERTALQARLMRYLREGGFPEAVGLETIDRRELLSSYVDGVILRDVVERHQVNNLNVLRRLVRHLLSNPGTPFSVNKFYNDLRSQGLAVSKDTLHAMLGYLEDAFLVQSVPYFAYSHARQRVHPRKVYPVDMGFIPFYTAPRPFPLGHALETCVFLHLLRRTAEVYYVRTPSGYEVDFAALTPSGELQLIQVCVDPADGATYEREVRALLEAAQYHPEATLHLITLETTPAPETPTPIRVHAAVEWLLHKAE